MPRVFQRTSTGLVRLRAMAAQHCRGDTLATIGRAHGVTRERVRQLLVQGTRLGVCRYNKHQRLCNRLLVLREALKTCLTGREVGRKLGFQRASLTRRELDDLGVSLAEVKSHLTVNLKAHLVAQFVNHKRRLGSLITAFAGGGGRNYDRAFRVDYARWQRRFGGGITAIRNAVALAEKPTVG